MTLELELPWPPSVNHYYRHVGPRVLISRDGRKYRELVTALVNRNGFRPFPGRISLRAEFYPPDWRRRDLDNVGGKVLCKPQGFSKMTVRSNESCLKCMNRSKAACVS